MGQANDAERKINGVGGLLGQFMVVNPGGVETWSKIAITSIGGIAIQLTNKTSVASVKGTVVKLSQVDDESFLLTGIDSDMPAGIVFEDGVADGSLCWVVVYGIAEVLLEDTTAGTRGFWVYASDTAGRANATLINPPGGGLPELDQHMREIGHCVASVGGGTDVLCKMLIQWN